MSLKRSSRPGVKWRRWNNILHRDLGYLCVALTIVYAVSGIAVNHMRDWNPNYDIERVQRTFDPFAVSDRQTMVDEAVARLDLPGQPNDSFRPEPAVLKLFYDEMTVEVHALDGTAMIEKANERFLVKDFNTLHLNHPAGLWTWIADAYAVLLLALAITGMFVLKGKKGFSGRGKWFILAGLVVPLIFLIIV
jgi:hypothetical protein